MLGSDMPFPIGDPKPREILNGLDITIQERSSIEVD